MSTIQGSPIRPRILNADKETLLAVKQMADFAAHSLTAEELQALCDAMTAAQTEQLYAENELKAKRYAADQAERTFHAAVQKVKLGVIAQYGEDSNQVASIGLKKRSNYKHRSPKSTAAMKPAA